MSADYVFSLLRVNKAYGRTVVLDGISLSFIRGARIVTTLLHEMRRRKARRGIATLCMSGGMGMAIEFERG